MNEQAQGPKITLTLDLEDINTILGGIGKLPLEVGIKVFNLIQSQAQAQLNPPTAPPAGE